MKRFLAFCVLLGINLIAISQSQPNILLIIADDMGIDVTPGFGITGNLPSTPTLDSLRAQGVTFTNCWASPQCTPTRASIMSGLYGIKTGVMDPPGPLDPVFTSVFNRAKTADLGYEMSVIGKWHLTGGNNLDHPQEHGVDHYEGVFSSGVEDYYEWTKVTNGVSSTVTEYTTSHLTELSIDWVNNQQEPWLLWLAHAAPHSPLQAPPAGLYTTEIVDDLTTYFAMIEAMDHEINRLIQSLSSEVRENTVVIFIGDNGTPNSIGEYFPRGHNKGSIYEGGLRVPLIISGVGVERVGTVDESLVHAADLHTTILDLMNQSVSVGLNNSKSILPLLKEAQNDFRPINYGDYNDDGVLVWATRTKQYKLIENELGQQEFYDLENDLEESNNLINSLDDEQIGVLEILQSEAAARRNGWSCNDDILNGEEVTIDDCAVILGSDDLTRALVYPNPSQGRISIALPKTQKSVIEVFSLEGSLLDRKSVIGSTSIELSGAQMYLIRIRDEDQKTIQTRKVVVKR